MGNTLTMEREAKTLVFTWSVSMVSIIGQLSLNIILSYLSDFPHTSTWENIVEQCLFTPAINY